MGESGEVGQNAESETFDVQMISKQNKNSLTFLTVEKISMQAIFFIGIILIYFRL